MSKTTHQETVGFIGLGAMGEPLTKRLLDAGYEVVVHDVNPEAMTRLKSAGAKLASSNRQVADLAQTVLVSLPTPAVVEAVAKDLIGGESMRFYVDLSTTGPTVARKVGAALADAGVECLDAPVSGGVQGAIQGTLSIMASGSEAAYNNALPLLQLFSKNIFHVGLEVGQGQIVKLANNMMGASAVVAALEGLAFCARGGIEPTRALSVFNASTGRSFATEIAIPHAVLSELYNLGFRMELMHKDLHLALKESEAMGAPMWHGANIGQYFSFAMTQGMAKEDFSAIAKIITNWAGTRLGTDAQHSQDQSR